ncbi:phage tail fiber protein [Buttiauxella ferragutiae ATCC 51602]|uniref:Phage tail fiber protein n=1 Tax=Buttiauxella ferragutiae ATCC 51602 TaxID=1354252 RepID=A0ABX2W732_9ENTR|nr:phage tail fiber protein [Buttiauxella ferragutiae ATCC 51602]
MQNIKGFKPSRGTAKSLANFGEAMTTIQFLESEGGLDWYECQALFADDTIKIMYDQNGVIVSVVDAPVPERGNTYAVSMFFPLNMSVAEVESMPEGFKLGAFVFDGENITAIPAPVQHKKTYVEALREEVAELKAMISKK